MNILVIVTLAVALADLLLFGASVWTGYQKAKGLDNEKDR